MTDNGWIDDDDLAGTRASRALDASLVERSRAGDPHAFGQLYDRWFDRTYALVQRILRDAHLSEEVCQEAFLSAWRGLPGLQDPMAFGGWLLRIARNGAYNRSEREGRSRPVDDEGMAVIESSGVGAGPAAPAGFDLESRLGRAEDPASAVADGEVAALVHESVAALGARDAEVLELQLRYELSPAEIGEVLGINRNAANQVCHRARGRFASSFRARLLWRGGRPACDALVADLATGGITSFGADAVTVIDRHASACAVCDERRRMLVQPSSFLAAIPFVSAPMLVKQRVAERLGSSGVPMEGSAASSGASSGSGSSGSSGSVSGSASPSSVGGAGPAPGLPAEVVSSSALAATRSGGWSARRVTLLAAALVVVALVGVLVLVRSSDDFEQVAATDVERTTVPTGAPSSTVVGVESPPPPSAADVAAEPRATTAPTTTAPMTTTTIAPAAVDLFELTPDTTQTTPYPLDSNSPVLRWRVSGASQVEVWLLSDTGGGATRTKVISTAASGELQVCPGDTTRNTCFVLPGTYSFELDVVGSDGGTVTTDPGSRPSFEVVAPIL